MEEVFIVEDRSSPDTKKEIPVYISSDSASEASEGETEVPKKKKKKVKNWVYYKKFANEKEALEFLESENTWSRNYTRATVDGRKNIYRCNKVKKRGPQCDAELYLLYVSDGDEVFVYRTDLEHNHDAIGVRDRTFGIDEKTKEVINKLVVLHLKPRAIIAAIEKMEGFKAPSEKQLHNYLVCRKATKKEKPAICLGELEKLILKHTDIPENEHEVFVISYYINTKDQPSFRFALSTKGLLKMIALTDVLHADAKHILSWQGFPVLVVGTTDKNRKFHPLCLGVASNEDQEGFQTIFEGLKEKAFLLYDHIMKPRVLVCDAAQSIQNAFLEVFGERSTVRMCWGHVKKNIQKKVEKSVSKEDQKTVLSDIDALHNATSPEVFNAASQAFLEKWKTYKAFVKYIEKEWLTKNVNWFKGAAPLSPATNNALELCVRNIKNQNILRERIPLAQFLSVSTDIVAQWSLENTSVPEELTIELEQWRDAYIWAKKDIIIQVIASDSNATVYLINSDNPNANHNDGWQSFDEYKEQSVVCEKTTLPMSGWQQGSCDCPEYFEKYMCKHILGLAIRLKLTKPPVEAKIIPTEQTRKRGRPAKAKAALIIP